MIFSLAWARAKPASKSRYFWMRLPSDQTCRMASVPKISLKIAESMVPVGMVGLSDFGDAVLAVLSCPAKAGHSIRPRSFKFVMPGLVPGIHAFLLQQTRRGWPGRARP